MKRLILQPGKVCTLDPANVAKQNENENDTKDTNTISEIEDDEHQDESLNTTNDN